VGYEHAQQIPQEQVHQVGDVKFGGMGDLQQQQQQVQMQQPQETLVEKRKRLGRWASTSKPEYRDSVHVFQPTDGFPDGGWLGGGCWGCSQRSGWGSMGRWATSLKKGCCHYSSAPHTSSPGLQKANCYR